MAFTVTATQGGGTSNGMLLRVKVLTGTAATQNGATVSSATALNANITTTTTGSIVYGALEGDHVAGAFSAEPLCTLIDNFLDSTNLEYYGSFRTTSATGTPGSTLVGSTTSNANPDMAAVEILPNGTITEDASAPAVATTTTATTVTTASFTPPAGALLVAIIGSDGAASGTSTTMSVTDTSGLGLTWTQAASAASTSTCYAGVWLAQMPGGSLTVATASLPLAEEGSPYSATLTATGGTTPYTWSISSGSLPAWASLNTSTGVISGTAPAAAGSTTFTVEVTDNASNTATQSLTLVVTQELLTTPAIPGLAVPGAFIPGQVDTEISVSSSDASGAGADGGESVTVLSTAPPPQAAALTSPTWRTRFRPSRHWGAAPLWQPDAYLDQDASRVVDGGEAVTVLDATGETGHGADAGEQVAATVPGSDAEAATDAGEQLSVMSAPVVVALSRTWQQRYRPYRHWMQAPLWQPDAYADLDASHGTDAGEQVAAAVTDSDTGHGADAGESVTVSLSSSDSVTGLDGFNDFEFCHGTDAGELVTASVSDSDASSSADGGESVTVLQGASPPAAAVRPSRTWLAQFARRGRPAVPVFAPVGAFLVADAEFSASADDARVFPQAAILILEAVS